MRGQLVLGLVVGAALSGGAAYATSTFTASSPVIHACYGNTTGALRLIDPTLQKKLSSSCRQDEAAIDWNTDGPAGEPGPPGPSGASDVWSDGPVHQVLIPKDPVTNVVSAVAMISLAVPPGNYVVNAAVTLDFPASSAAGGCSVFGNGEDAETVHANAAGGRGGDSELMSAPIVGTFSLPNGGTLELECNQNDRGPGRVQADATLVAQQVGTLH